MDEQKFEQLVRDHPDLFQKCDDEYFSVGNGWYNILRVLCGFISYDVNQIRYKIRYATENPNNKYAESILVLEKKLADAIDALPVISQVKEKFGTLRFYIDNSNDTIDHYVSFAEAMSSVTCEECGALGEHRNDGWIKVLCDKHHRERSAKNDPVKHTFSKNLPPVFEE